MHACMYVCNPFLKFGSDNIPPPHAEAKPTPGFWDSFTCCASRRKVGDGDVPGAKKVSQLLKTVW